MRDVDSGISEMYLGKNVWTFVLDLNLYDNFSLLRIQTNA